MRSYFHQWEGSLTSIGRSSRAARFNTVAEDVVDLEEGDQAEGEANVWGD